LADSVKPIRRLWTRVGVLCKRRVSPEFREATKEGPMRSLVTLALLSVSLAAAAPIPEAAQALAGRCGLDAWSQVEEIRFTFNVQSARGGVHRSWRWEPRTNQVTAINASGEETSFTTANGSMPEGDPMRETDGRFINDQYWLLFPFHLAWDTGLTVTDDGGQPAPFGLGELPQITAAYGGEGGYTPGDTYRLHIGENGLPAAWTFLSHEGGDPRPMTWESWSRVGPLTIALDHQNPETGTRLWFTDVSVRVGGEWHTPEPLE
jgi:hypothetical protein